MRPITDAPARENARENWPRQESGAVALKGHCPCCGQGKLFKGPLSLGFRERCPVCDLDHTRADIGDGTVVPVMMVANLLVLALAMWMHFGLELAVWLNALVTILVALVVVGGLTRFMKAWLYAQQFRHDAAPGRVTTR